MDEWTGEVAEGKGGREGGEREREGQGEGTAVRAEQVERGGREGGEGRPGEDLTVNG